MADQKINELPTKTAPSTGDKMLMIGAAEEYQIDYDKLATAILNKLSTQSFSSLETTAKTVLGGINELNSKLYLPIRSLGNETDVDNYLDNYSDSFPNNTHYYTAISLTATHPKLGGGAHLIEGYKSNGNFEWQQATTYNPAGGIIRRVRSKYSGIWSDWVALKNS